MHGVGILCQQNCLGLVLLTCYSYANKNIQTFMTCIFCRDGSVDELCHVTSGTSPYWVTMQLLHFFNYLLKTLLHMVRHGTSCMHLYAKCFGRNLPQCSQILTQLLNFNLFVYIFHNLLQ